jgi:hypothetical protein
MTKIANKTQLKPESFDPIRSIINSRTIITKESINNGSIELIESYYNLTNVAQTEYAIQYTKADNNILESDNRSFIIWFNFPNDYAEGKAISKTVIAGYDVSSNKYVMLNNMNSGETMGYKIWYQSDYIYFMINDTVHKMSGDIMTNIWYGLLINMDQRQRECNMKLLRRNAAIIVVLFQPDTYEKLELDAVEDAVDIQYEISQNGFKPVDNIEITSNEVNPSFITVSTYLKTDVELKEFSHDENLKINGSKIKLSNIRVMNDLVKPEAEQIILNELIIRDSEHLILGDNATKKLFTTNFPNKQWR